MTPGIDAVYIAEPIYTENVKKEIELETNTRLVKDQFLKAAWLDSEHLDGKKDAIQTLDCPGRRRRPTRRG
jgi:hypothetical protein